MAFFDTRKRLEALEQDVEKSPTPVSMVQLIERFLAAGQNDKALEWARKAVERFPDSEKCVATFENIQRMRLQREIVDLNQAIRKTPSRANYEKLATIYLNDLGNRNKSYELALEGLNKFPQSDGLHMICGMVRMDRFHSEYLANDFTEAVHHFQRASEITPASAKPFILLARLHAEVGVFDRAKGFLENAKGGMDSQADRLVRFIESKATESADLDDTLSQVENRRGLPQDGLEVRKIFEPLPRGGTILQISPIKLEEFLSRFGTMPGYRASVIITREGQAMAAHTAGKLDRQRFTHLVQAILRCCDDASKRMDIGTFVNAEIETSVGRVSIAEWKNFIIGILADSPAKKSDVDAAIEKFVSFLSTS